MKIIPYLFYGLKIITIFAECLISKQRSNIRKWLEINENIELKNMKDETMKDLEKEDLAMIAKRVKYQLDRLTEEADNYSKRMNEDYVYFFRWYSECMYKVQLQLSEYQKLRAVVLTGSLDEVRQYLENKVKNITYDLLNGRKRLNSPNEIIKLVYTLDLELEQQVREEFIDYLESMKTTVKR